MNIRLPVKKGGGLNLLELQHILNWPVVIVMVINTKTEIENNRGIHIYIYEIDTFLLS